MLSLVPAFMFRVLSIGMLALLIAPQPPAPLAIVSDELLIVSHSEIVDGQPATIRFTYKNAMKGSLESCANGKMSGEQDMLFFSNFNRNLTGWSLDATLSCDDNSASAFDSYCKADAYQEAPITLTHEVTGDCEDGLHHVQVVAIRATHMCASPTTEELASVRTGLICKE